MTSQFAYCIHQQRRELLEGLVGKLLGVQADEENFGLALDFCLQKAYHHTFLDVHPPETEAFYAECVARLEADSQLSKAAALSALTSKLLALPLQSPHGVQALNHKLLQLLACLANQPLSSSLDLSAPDVLELLYKPAAQLGGGSASSGPAQHGQQLRQSCGASHFQRLLQAAAAGTCGSEGDAASTASSDAEVDPYGDDSSLSDWDSEGQQLQSQSPREALGENEGGQQQQQQSGDEPEQEPQGVSASAAQPALQATALSATLGLRQPRLPLGCVAPGPQQPLTKLMAVRPGRMELQQWQQQLLPRRLSKQQQRLVCYSERFLAQQVLRVLQGLPAQGFVLQTAPAAAAAVELEGSTSTLSSASSTSSCGSSGIGRLCSWQQFVVDPCMSTPHLLPSVLQSLLSDVAAAGTCARQLRALVQQLSSSSSSSSAGLVITPCLRALGAALQQQLDLLGLQLTDLQQQLTQQQAQLTKDTGTNPSCSSSGSNSHMGSRPGQQQEQERGVLLLLVKHQVRPVVRRLQLLHATLFQQVLQELGGPPAAVSAQVVDSLAAAVQAAATHAASRQCVADASALLHLLLSCCVPLSRALAQWLWSAADGAVERHTAAGQPAASDAHNAGSGSCGGVSVCSQDFFITRQASRDVAAAHPSFWHTAYSFWQQEGSSSSQAAVTSADGARAAAAGGSGSNAAAKGRDQAQSPPSQVCCPAVLAPLVQRIMTAGKSMRLLDHLHQQDQQHSISRSSTTSRPGPAAAGSPRLPAGAGAGAGVQQQQPQQQGGGAGRGAGAVLQRQPSTPRRRRPSNAGRAPGLTTAAASGAGGRISRQPSMAGDGVVRPAAAAVAAADGSTDKPTKEAEGKVGGRRRWGEDGPTQQQGQLLQAKDTAPGAGAAGSKGMSVRVRLQLATAAAVAGQQEQEELPEEFISTACYILQQEQQLHRQGMQQVWQHQQQLQQVGNGCSSAADLLMRRLEAVASSLAQPHSLAAAGLEGAAAAAAGCGVGAADCSSAGPQVPAEPLSLRVALAAARKARLAGAAALSGSAQPVEGATAGAAVGSSAAVAAPDQDVQPAADNSLQQSTTTAAMQKETGTTSHSTADAEASSPNGKAPASPAAASPVVAPATPPHADSSSAALAAAPGSGAEQGSSGSSAGVLPLMAVRDQLQAQLIAAGQQLQRMAPWGQEADSQDDTAAQADTRKQGHRQQQEQPQNSKQQAGKAELSSSSWLLRAAATKAPGHFSSSLAELWPLQPVLGLRGATAAGGNSSSSSKGRCGWLRAASWPSSELSWLLHGPPAHLPAVQQLLASALIQPVRTRVELVDRQLLSGLMGEWGMLQQLQGLVNVFLTASPSIVEWVDGLFEAVEAAQGGSGRGRGDGEDPSTPTAASRTAARTAAGGSRPGSAGVALMGVVTRQWPVDVEHLELMPLEDLLQDCVLSAGPDEVLPDPEALLLTCDTAELASKRRQVQERQQQRQPAQQGWGSAAAAGAGGSVPGAVSGAGSVPRDAPLDARATGGLLACSGEWVALQLRHTGSWQLSLVYNDEQLRTFTKVWRLMLQLRWVRRRVGAQVLSHRSSASITDLCQRDRQEAAQAAAAAAAVSSSSSRRGLSGAAGAAWQQHGRAHAAAAAGPMPWLSSKEELLLLQEMWHFLGCWHAYVLDGACVAAWGKLEQALLSAQSLDQVHAATSAFLGRVCSLCNLVPPGSKQDSKVWQQATHKDLEDLMDAALAAAAAAGRLQAARQKLQELQALGSGQPGAAEAWWLELGSARNALVQARQQWCSGLQKILGRWRMLERHNAPHAFDELQGLLDMNGYFSRAQAWQEPKRV